MRTYTHCIRCGKEKKMPPRLQKGMTEVVYKADPFCSSACAVAHHKKGRAA